MGMLTWMKQRATAKARVQIKVCGSAVDRFTFKRSFMNSMILLRNTPHRFPQTFMNFDRAILQKYAKRFGGSSSSLPPTTLLVNTETSLTLFDKYPKATYHFLLLPRILTNSVFTVGDLANLHTLLSKRKKEEAKGLIEGLKKDAETVREMIEKEMLKKQGYKWDVWIGFHAVPSMVYVLERWQRWPREPLTRVSNH